MARRAAKTEWSNRIGAKTNTGSMMNKRVGQCIARFNEQKQRDGLYDWYVLEAERPTGLRVKIPGALFEEGRSRTISGAKAAALAAAATIGSCSRSR